MRNTIATASIIAVALIGGMSLAWWQQAENTSQAANAWVFETLDGASLSHSDLKADRTLVNFWATWCPPCLRELPLLSELSVSHSSDELAVLAVAYDDPKNIHPFLDENPLELQIAHGFANVKSAMTTYGNETGSLPFSVLLDKKGNVIKTHLGELHPDTLREFVSP